MKICCFFRGLGRAGTWKKSSLTGLNVFDGKTFAGDFFTSSTGKISLSSTGRISSKIEILQ